MGLNLCFQGRPLKAFVDVMKLSMDVGKVIEVFVNIIFSLMHLFYHVEMFHVFNSDAVIRGV